MATTTENLGLTIPAGTDRAEISVLNENFQKLDTFAGQATDDIQQAQETANAAAPQSTTYTKTEVDTALDEKVDKVSGKGLSTNDFTTAEKNKLSGIEAGATKTIVDAVLSSTSTNPVQNKSVQAPVTRLVDAGAKNLLDASLIALKQFNTSSSATWIGNDYTYNGITYSVYDDGTIAVSGTATGASFLVLANRAYLNSNVPRGKYAISGCPTGGGSSGANYRIYCLNPSTQASGYTDTGGGYVGDFYYDNSADCNIAIGIGSGCVIENPIVFKPMLCTAEDYAISPEFVPYAPSNRELYEEVEAIENNMQVPSFDTSAFSSLSAYIDTLSNGTYSFFVPNNNTLTDVPMNDSNGIVTAKVYNTNTVAMDFVAISTTYQMYRYSRIKSAGTWRGWYKFEGTAVT